MVPAENKVKTLSLVNRSKKTICHHGIRFYAYLDEYNLSFKMQLSFSVGCSKEHAMAELFGKLLDFPESMSNVLPSVHYFYVKTKMLADFQTFNLGNVFAQHQMSLTFFSRNAGRQLIKTIKDFF